MLKYTIWIFLFLHVAGCARLPDYAKPHYRLFAHEKYSLEDGLTYRQLKVEDFRAMEPPKDLKPHAKKLNAHICTTIRLTGDSEFTVNPVKFRGKRFYFAGIKNIAFEAVMIPSCSWWNPKIPEEKKAYVLQHEQIHFALTEITARKLTEEAQEVAESLLIIQSTREAAYNDISTRVKDMVKTAMDENIRENTAFDQDTSLFFDPEKQRRWLQSVEEQLEKTAPKKQKAPEASRNEKHNSRKEPGKRKDHTQAKGGSCTMP